MTKFQRSMAVAGVVMTTLLYGGVAYAVDPTSPTEVATTGVTALTPIILGVGGVLVAVAALRFGVRWVLSSIGRGGRA